MLGQRSGLSTMESTNTFINSLPPVVVKGGIVVLGVLAIYVAVKIAHFVFKIIFALIGLGLIGFLVWWEFLR